jgi:hypothetical protein
VRRTGEVIPWSSFIVRRNVTVERELIAKVYFENVPEVLPDDRWHDGWDGAAGAEVQDRLYEPYPHEWDLTLTWCRVRFASYYNMCEELDIMERPVERIPHWIVRRALPYVER